MVLRTSPFVAPSVSWESSELATGVVRLWGVSPDPISEVICDLLYQFCTDALWTLSPTLMITPTPTETHVRHPRAHHHQSVFIFVSSLAVNAPPPVEPEGSKPNDLSASSLAIGEACMDFL